MNCERATKLLSDAQERTLSRRERFGLRLHLLLCLACRRFNKHLQLIRYLLVHAPSKLLAAVYASDARLSESRRQKIKTLMRQIS